MKEGLVMKLWTIQPKTIYEDLLREGVVFCKPELSEFVQEWNFEPAYDWLAKQMQYRIGAAPTDVRYPIWAWYVFDGKNEKPDLRKPEFRYYREDQACIELEIPDQHVLLSDEEEWHIVLNNDYLVSDNISDEEFEREYDWFRALPEREQKTVKQKSWERIFDVFKEDGSSARYIQATFWELRLEYVKSVRFFKGRLKEAGIN